MFKIDSPILAVLLLLGACLITPADAAAGPGYANGLIVKFRAGSVRFRQRTLSAADALALSRTAATPLTAYRAMSGNKQVLVFANKLSMPEAEAAAHRL